MPPHSRAGKILCICQLSPLQPLTYSPHATSIRKSRVPDGFFCFLEKYTENNIPRKRTPQLTLSLSLSLHLHALSVRLPLSLSLSHCSRATHSSILNVRAGGRGSRGADGHAESGDVAPGDSVKNTMAKIEPRK